MLSLSIAVPSSAFSCLCGYKFNGTVFIALLLSAVLYHFSTFAFAKSSYIDNSAAHKSLVGHVERDIIDIRVYTLFWFFYLSDICSVIYLIIYWPCISVCVMSALCLI